jgi:glycerophosphoryl diester phosphodiesterase
MRALVLLVLTLSITTAAERILVHGHRGARARLPENTIPAFEYAIRAGVDVLELDLAVTKDNVVVVSHDPILSATICRGPHEKGVIRQLTFAELSQWDCGALRNPGFANQQAAPGTRIPTLDQVLALAPRGTFEFNIETKSFPDKPELTPPPHEFARLVLDQVRKHGLEKRVMLQSFDFRTLQAMKKLAPEIRLAALTADDPRDFRTIAKESGAGIVSPHFSLVTRQKTAQAQAAGLQVVPWTANTPAEWKKLADAGVDAIITDDPEALIVWLKQRGDR